MKVRRLELDFNPLLIETLLHTPSLLPSTPSGIPRIGASTCPLPSSSENFNLFRCGRYRSGLVSISQFVTEEFSTAFPIPPRFRPFLFVPETKSRVALPEKSGRVDDAPTSHDLHNSYRIKNQTGAASKSSSSHPRPSFRRILKMLFHVVWMLGRFQHSSTAPPFYPPFRSRSIDPLLLLTDELTLHAFRFAFLPFARSLSLSLPPPLDPSLSNSRSSGGRLHASTNSRFTRPYDRFVPVNLHSFPLIGRDARHR